MAVDELLRVYLDPAEIGIDGYPHAWHNEVRSPDEWENVPENDYIIRNVGGKLVTPAIKNLVREQDGHRCIRCQHPFVVGKTPGEWSPCDVNCTHGLPLRLSCAGYLDIDADGLRGRTAGDMVRGHDEGPCSWHERTHESPFSPIEAQWRVLTVHHLNGIKHDCRWWNLVSLCQRDHLYIQSKVRMERPWHDEHSEWFKIYAAGYYAWAYLSEELTREETAARLDELLALEQTHATQRLW